MQCLKFNINSKSLEKFLKLAPVSNLAEFCIDSDYNLMIKNYASNFSSFFEAHLSLSKENIIQNYPDIIDKKLAIDIGTLLKTISILKKEDIVVSINYSFLEVLLKEQSIIKLYFLDKSFKNMKDLSFDNIININKDSLGLKLKLLKVVNTTVLITLKKEYINLRAISPDKCNYIDFNLKSEENISEYSNNAITLLKELKIDIANLDKYLNLVDSTFVNLKFCERCYEMSFSNEALSGRAIFITEFIN